MNIAQALETLGLEGVPTLDQIALAYRSKRGGLEDEAEDLEELESAREVLEDLRQHYAQGGPGILASMRLGEMLRDLTLRTGLRFWGPASLVVSAVFAAGVGWTRFSLSEDLAAAGRSEQLEAEREELVQRNRELADEMQRVRLGDDALARHLIESPSEAPVDHLELETEAVFVAALPEPWRPLDPGTCDDLDLLADLSGASRVALHELFPGMSAFYEENPSRVWVRGGPDVIPSAETEGRRLYPFLVLTRLEEEDADLLLRQFEYDLRNTAARISGDALLILIETFGEEVVFALGNALMEAESSLNFDDAPRLLLALVPEEERAHVEQALNEALVNLPIALERLENEVLPKIEVPLRLAEDAYGTIGGVDARAEAASETGLMLGRLLLFVLCASGGGQVDVELIQGTYDGFLVRTETTGPIDPYALDEADDSIVVKNEILVLSSKRDLLLVHAHVPMDADGRESWSQAQEWLRQVRMLRRR